jgi:hypothetical protein
MFSQATGTKARKLIAVTTTKETSEYRADKGQSSRSQAKGRMVFQRRGCFMASRQDETNKQKKKKAAVKTKQYQRAEMKRANHNRESRNTINTHTKR